MRIQGKLTTPFPPHHHNSLIMEPQTESSSPRVFRTKERDEFRHLNDRLAAYIEAVKNLKGPLHATRWGVSMVGSVWWMRA